MPEKKNALAELAEELTPEKVLRIDGKSFGYVCFDSLIKAQRIVAELGKPERIDGRIAREIMAKCREIAEEGAKDGK